MAFTGIFSGLSALLRYASCVNGRSRVYKADTLLVCVTAVMQDVQTQGQRVWINKWKTISKNDCILYESGLDGDKKNDPSISGNGSQLWLTNLAKFPPGLNWCSFKVSGRVRLLPQEWTLQECPKGQCWDPHSLKCTLYIRTMCLWWKV